MTIIEGFINRIIAHHWFPWIIRISQWSSVLIISYQYLELNHWRFFESQTVMKILETEIFSSKCQQPRWPIESSNQAEPLECSENNCDSKYFRLPRSINHFGLTNGSRWPPNHKVSLTLTTIAVFAKDSLTHKNIESMSDETGRTLIPPRIAQTVSVELGNVWLLKLYFGSANFRT